MRLNIFSPLPPLHSDVANYTVRVATALAEVAEVTLWTAQAGDLAVPDFLPVTRFTPGEIDWQALHRADLNIYNLGNNASYHRAIFDVARQAPGLMILHDTRLQHFFAGYSEIPGEDRAFYLRLMHRYHGEQGLRDAQGFLAGRITIDQLVDRFPLTLAALDTALAAIMHNAADADALAGLTRTPIIPLDLPYPSGPEPAPPPPSPVLRLVTFGFIGLNRRVDGILDALAGLPDTAVELDIFGKLEEPARIEARIAALGLAGRVRLRGFVSDSELDRALAASDLAFNLRFPSMGEASGSQLRIWNAALPSLVTRTGWYAGLPEDAVFFVAPETEVDDIRAHLTLLRRDPGRFRDAGRRGRAILLARHDPASYAAAQLRAVQPVDVLHGRRHAVDLSRAAVQELLAVTGLEGVTLAAGQLAAAVSQMTGGRD